MGRGRESEKARPRKPPEKDRRDCISCGLRGVGMGWGGGATGRGGGGGRGGVEKGGTK